MTFVGDDLNMKNFDQKNAKFKELVLLLAEKSEGDASFGATKLNKLLFYVDFLAYRQFGEPVTGQEYFRLSYGPAPKRLLPLVGELEATGDCSMETREVFGNKQRRLVAKRQADVDVFAPHEIALIDEVLDLLGQHNAAEVSDLSHDLPGWQVADDQESIPFETIFVAPARELTQAEITHGQSL